MLQSQKNIGWNQALITREDRYLLNQHKSCVLWFTGLSGAGKSTLSVAVEEALYHSNIRSYILDGDNIRQGLNKDLGFSPEDRKENIRRIGEVAKLFVDSGLIVLAAFISPYREDREAVRALFTGDSFIEIYVKCSLEECARRDPKGFYEKARKGEIKNFTGITDPYEEPICPELIIETDHQDLEDSVAKIINYLKTKRLLIR
ncbi:adenylyl-sulfate kinase [Paenibacillus woosongensis]|uniref:Adenylyl-sulfate kinase n=1 Tax=Paenibacillus woosongensis TaxID=307580 RepID=A0A7X3CNR9_9BACL|nr:adenylyl-sulfate kinase [Paenibacillus woosongensis]